MHSESSCILLFLCSISSFSRGLTSIKRYLETFYGYSIVCSRELLFWYYFNPVSKFYFLVEFSFNYWKEWMMQNTICDFFNFFSYLERTIQLSLLSPSVESWTLSLQPALCYCDVKILNLFITFLWRRYFSMFCFKHGTDFEYAWVYLRKHHFSLIFGLIFIDMNNLEVVLSLSFMLSNYIGIYFPFKILLPLSTLTVVAELTETFWKLCINFFPCCTS